eukprot:TRINITY_DN72347_c0_g1_i1.p1 TRINITY_DN72347_c0_g1~~TRINITY_DN72347_c0_g1_i1.p1  ORF type:complete len:821 (+),score=204.70 TRINITY_DN72347_c0_g1_i1:142-2604(+)
MADTARREAAQLYSSAEAFLRDEQIEDCIRESSRAVEIFEGCGREGMSGLADALVMLIDAHKQLAVSQQEKPQQALTLAQDYLAKFIAAGDRRGEATMLLALADCNHDKRGRKKRTESLELAAEALEIFRAIEDKKSEACTLIVMAMAHFKFFMYDDMLHEAQCALDLLEELGDKFHLARALNVVGLALSYQRRLDPAMDKGKAALSTWRELGLRRQEAMQLNTMCGWLRFARWPKKALVLAEQSLLQFRSVGPSGLPGGAGYRREAQVVGVIIELMVELKQHKSALKFAQASCDRFVEVGSPCGQGIAKEAIGRIYIALDKTDKAIEVVDEARGIADELGDKKWSAKLLYSTAQAHMRGKAPGLSLETLDKAIALAEEAGDTQEVNRLQQNLIDGLLHQGNMKAALRVATEARAAAAQKSGDKRAEATFILREAQIKYAMTKAEEAIALAKQAQELYQESYWPRGEAGALQFVADVCLQRGDIEGALESGEERLAILREMNDPVAEIYGILFIASVHLKDENFAEADKLAQEAQQMSRKETTDTKTQVEVLVFLEQVCSAQAIALLPDDKAGKPLVDRAVRAVNEALQLAGKAENRMLRAMVLFRRAQTMVLARRIAAALRDIKDAIVTFEALEQYNMLGRSLLQCATMKYGLGKDDEAAAEVEQANVIAQDTNDQALAKDVENLRKTLEDRKRQEAEALRTPQVAQPQLAQGPKAAQAPVAAQAAAEVSAAAPVSKGLDPAYVHKALASMVKDAIASDEDEVELDTPFMDAGMDSLSSVALMSMVAKEFSMSLSPSLVFDFPTLRAMEDHLIAESKER